MSEVELLDAFAAWYDTHRQAAESAGIGMTFGRTNDGRNKHSAWLGLDYQRRLGELIVWDSGEAEYMIGGEGNPVLSEHHEIGSQHQLVSLLERLLDEVVRQHSPEQGEWNS